MNEFIVYERQDNFRNSSIKGGRISRRTSRRYLNKLSKNYHKNGGLI